MAMAIAAPPGLPRLLRNARPSLSLGRLFGSSAASFDCVPLPSASALVDPAAAALDTAAGTLSESLLFKQGEKVAACLAGALSPAAVQAAWLVVQQQLQQRGAEILQLLRGHPYVVSLGLAVVAGAFVLSLIKRQLAQFSAATDTCVDQVIQLDSARLEGTPLGLPEAFRCPITLEVMKDPYITPSGHSYERKALEQWIETKGTDPQTRAPLLLAQVIPNRALRDSIELWMAQATSPLAAAA